MASKAILAHSAFFNAGGDRALLCLSIPKNPEKEADRRLTVFFSA